MSETQASNLLSDVAQWHLKSGTVLDWKMPPGWIQEEYVIPRYYDHQL